MKKIHPDTIYTAPMIAALWGCTVANVYKTPTLRATCHTLSPHRRGPRGMWWTGTDVLKATEVRNAWRNRTRRKKP